MSSVRTDPGTSAREVTCESATGIPAPETSDAPRPKALFINRSYWPDAEATGQLLTELCEDLARHFDVQVVTGQPNSNPAGESYRIRGAEQRNGVEIHRTPHTRFPKQSLAGRGLNLVSFFLTALWTTWRLPRPDVVIVETDPFFLAFLGLWLKFRHGCRCIVYLQDIYPDIAVALDRLPEGVFAACLRRLLTACYKRADRVVVLSQDMRDVIMGFGVSASQIETLPNWVDTTCIVPMKRDNGWRAGLGMDHKFVVMYSGNMGLSQPLDLVLQAAAALHDRPEVQFLLVGDGVARRRLEERAAEMRLTNVRFLPYQPREELACSLSTADLHLVTVDPRVYRLLMPCKLYAILATGTPLVAIAPHESELSRTVVAQQVGFAVACGDLGALTASICWGVDHRREMEQMGERARELAVTLFDRRVATERFGRLLGKIADGSLRAACGGADRPAAHRRLSELSQIRST
jgi:glycosyltransferase involved in cell wall biosynthesis